MQIESRSYHTTISPGRGIFVCTDGTETEAVVEFIRKRVYVFMFIQSRTTTTTMNGLWSFSQYSTLVFVNGHWRESLAWIVVGWVEWNGISNLYPACWTRIIFLDHEATLMESVVISDIMLRGGCGWLMLGCSWKINDVKLCGRHCWTYTINDTIIDKKNKAILIKCGI